MGTFSAEWLTLREPADRAARSPAATSAIAGLFAARGTVDVLDLAAGTGSNVRYLSPHLPRDQQWLLVDHDPDLLAQAASLVFPWGQPATQCADLRSLDVSMFSGRDLVTSSALLDLVSVEWVRLLARRCRDEWAPVLCALIYDGRILCEPEDEADVRVRDLVNRHQATDKGFGPALGPSAAEAAADAFRSEGYQVRLDRSDWLLDAAVDARLQEQLVDGWASAASEIAPAEAATIHAWRTRRLGHVSAGRSRIRVGHQDLAAWPS